MRNLSLTSLLTTLVLVAVGGFTRGSGSGYGCEDRWPLCKDGALGGLLPRADFHMIVEWSHRWLAATVGLLVLATAVQAWRHRSSSTVRWCTTVAVAVVGIQAWVGRMIVVENLKADLVSLHLAISMTVVGLLSVATVMAAGPRHDASQPETSRNGAGFPGRLWTVALGFSAAGSYLLLLLGSYVHNRYYPGWPLMNDEFLPELVNSYATVHLLHRTVAGLGIVVVAWLTWQVSRREVSTLERRLVYGAALAYLGNVLLGLAHVITEVRLSGVVTAHLAFAGLVWCQLVAATAAAARRTSRAAK